MNYYCKYMTRNDCYQSGRYIVPKGIMVHSTATPGVMAGDWYSRWNKSYKAGEIDRQVCVTAFVDDTAVWQYLPWDMRAWHGGGSSNNTHIGFEICEPKDWTTNKEYFDKAYANAVELCAMLCKKFNLASKDIVSHKEGYRLGIASNHGDPDHWWKYFGKTMDDLRADVDKVLNTPAPAPVEQEVRTVDITLNVLKRTAKGEQVKTIQRILRSMGYRGKDGKLISIDGSFGGNTDYALRNFQKANDLDVDGSCGFYTWSALLK